MIPAGTLLRNRYQIIKLLGYGGFGDTYLAQDKDLPGHPFCVVKHLKPKDPNPAVLPIARRLFESEAQVLYKLGQKSERIPTLSAHFEEKGEFYFVQDFIDGEDLTKELIPGRRLSEQQVRDILQGILEALEIAHQNNVIHRDIKPANLMRRKDDGQIVLIDFGAVKEIGTLIINSQGQTTVSVVVGTHGYIPSEQARGKPKLCSDIYAVGMIGIQGLTGISPDQLPENPNNGEVIWRNNAQVSSEFAAVLDKMVRDHFSQRYQNATDALQALNSLGLKIPPTVPVIPQQNTVTRRNWLQLAAFGGVGFVVAVISKDFWNKQPENVVLAKETPLREPIYTPTLEPKSTPTPTETPTTPSNENPKLFYFDFTTVTVNSWGEIMNRRQAQTQFFKDNLGNGVGLEMVAIQGGTFMMGSPETEAIRESDESPQHQVTVKPFYLGKYPVTQAQWQAVMGNNPSNFIGNNRPVETVSWDDAVQFCQKLSQLTGRNYRLPSEAEWEYACRAGTSTPFYFGETITPDLVNYDGNYPYAWAPKGKYREQTTDVGSFPPNAFGLYDMHGNVWEWCLDVWHQNYNGAPKDGSAWEAGGNSQYRLRRGGSWDRNARSCRCANRVRHQPGDRWSSSGFRVAVSPGFSP
ncbi:bifunctional serine/threonine-protein kinase/formylglycine-generating enzyme family protein [Ancylothrix sp. C2]|uniref:bifunctional serine/threonine-protein kinase/formylglycine-generating enzyme family protein n=1 Tax=Ancylothrix sp. D3o TaxID=2953691 RepID=UPI0021BA7385|nr:bifunctional serine/threonine-protein kinase/formylglycine-generating enzyme family protein [Ancylothrix sp. D3o]MCT7949960.1 bifunctional serine/threonine-protein kinase/formylglycine-generating enzyme family protein [Ancylothrix sp. D3o]